MIHISSIEQSIVDAIISVVYHSVDLLPSMCVIIQISISGYHVQKQGKNVKLTIFLNFESALKNLNVRI